MPDERISYAVRIFALILLPFILGMWVLPHTQQMGGQVLRAVQDNRSASSEYILYTLAPNAQETMVPSSVNAVFPLADYLDFPPFVIHQDPQVCFADRGSYFNTPSGLQAAPDFPWTILINDVPTVEVRPYSVSCVPLGNSTQSYTWSTDMNRTASGIDPAAVFVPQIATYPAITMNYGLLQGLMLIPVAYLFIWYPAAGIVKKIHKGLLEQ